MTVRLPQPSLFRHIFIASFLSLVLLQGQVFARESISTEDWDILADQILHYENPESIIATGNVTLTNRADQTLKMVQGDWLSYDVEKANIKIRGNTKINDTNGQVNKSLFTTAESQDSIILSRAMAGDHLNSWLINGKTIPTTTTTTPPASNHVVAQQDSPPNTQRATNTNQMPSATNSKPSVSTEEWDIAADKVMRYDNPNSVVAIGDVVLKKRERLPPKASASQQQRAAWSDLLGEAAGPAPTTMEEVDQKTSVPEYETTTTIYADWIAYDVDIGVINAKGNVRINNGQEELYAHEGKVKLENQTGSFDNATIIQESKLHLEGDSISKTGVDTYSITNGWVITCKVEEGQTPPWSIASSQTEIKKGGYAVLKHARFNIKGVPVFYTPYFVIPVKNTRQTGFLFPELTGSDNSGFGVNTPFFWNISESTDMTLYPQYFEKRGFMPGAAFRYVLSAEEKGTIDTNYLNDSLDPALTDYTHTNSDRFWVRGKADHTFGDDWLARLDVDLVSDKDYLKEFDSGVTSLEKSNDRYLEAYGRGFSDKTEMLRDNTLNLMKSWENTFLEVGFLAVNDIRADDNGEDIDTDSPFWALPNVNYSGALPIFENPGFFQNPAILDWNTQYVNYWREEGYGGHRFDLQPTLGTNLPLSEYLESRAEAGIRTTQYFIQEYGTPTSVSDQWNDDSTKNRFLYTFETEVATTLERDYFWSDESSAGGDHTIRPFVKYSYVPDVNQDDLPDFDSIDRVDEENGITYGFDTSFLLFNSDPKNGHKERTYTSLEVEQTYNLADLTLYDSDATSYIYEYDFSDIAAKLKWYPLERSYVGYKTKLSVYGDAFTSHTFEGGYSSERGDSARLEYSFKDNDDIEQINSYFSLYIASNWFAQFEIEHSLQDNQTEESKFGITYRQPCWAVTLGTAYTPEDTKFTLLFELANLGSPFGASL